MLQRSRCAFSASHPRRHPLAYLIAAALPVIATPGFAMTFTVNTLNDTVSGSASTGSLRDGLIATNASTDASNTIQFQPGLSGTIALTAPLPLVFSNLTIDGSGATVIIDGGAAYRIFFVGVDTATQTTLHTSFPTAPLANPLQVTMRNLTLANGMAHGGNGGGGGMGAGGALFVNSASTVTLDGVNLNNAQAIGGSGTANSSAGAHLFGGGGGLGGNGGKAGVNSAGGGGIFGLGASSTGAGGGGIFGNAGYGPGGGGGYVGDGGSYGGAGGTGRALGGITGKGGNGYNNSQGGANGGGGGGGANFIAGGGGGFGGSNAATGVGGNAGFGGGGAGGQSTGGNGGFGGGGGSGPNNGANNGNGGFGGGGAVSSNGTGGVGGFGGGGGDGGAGGGAGGFGAGGGGSRVSAGSGGLAGFGGGSGSPSGGGGGAGFGGAVFVVNGGTLSINGASMSEAGSSAAGGTTAASGAGTGRTAGNGLYLQGSGTLRFSPNAGSKQALGDSIADDIGTAISPPAGYAPGQWSLQKDGLGTLVLSATASYKGATTVSAGVLRDDASNASSVTVNAGATLGGVGSFPNVTSAGNVVPGNAVSPHGVLTVTNTITEQSSAVSCFHLGVGPPVTSSIAAGTANLAGVARLDVTGLPAVSNTFHIVNAVNATGSFTGFVVNNRLIDGTITYAPTQVTFTVTAIDGIFRDQFEGGNDDSACAAVFAP